MTITVHYWTSAPADTPPTFPGVDFVVYTQPTPAQAAARLVNNIGATVAGVNAAFVGADPDDTPLAAVCGFINDGGGTAVLFPVDADVADIAGKFGVDLDAGDTDEDAVAEALRAFAERSGETPVVTVDPATTVDPFTSPDAAASERVVPPPLPDPFADPVEPVGPVVPPPLPVDPFDDTAQTNIPPPLPVDPFASDTPAPSAAPAPLPVDPFISDPSRSESPQTAADTDSPTVTNEPPAATRPHPQHRAGHGRGKIIAVTAPKGGVGKTTTAAHIATVVAEQGTVLLIDADIGQPDANRVLTIPSAHARNLIGATGPGLDPDRLEANILYPGTPGWDYGFAFLAGPGQTEATVVSPIDVRSAIDVAATMFDFVVVDTAVAKLTSPFVTEGVIPARPDLWLILSTPDQTVASNVYGWAEILKGSRSSASGSFGVPSPKIWIAVCTMNSEASFDEQRAGTVFPSLQFAGTIPYSARISRARSDGGPIIPDPGVASAVAGLLDVMFGEPGRFSSAESTRRGTGRFRAALDALRGR